MKLQPTTKSPTSGGILIVALITSMAIGIVLASVMALVSNRYRLSVRSLGWNAALPVAEAGIEEALSHLKTDANAPSANNWAAATIGGQPVNTKTRYFPDGSYYYVVIYNGSSTSPVIYSTGFTPSPLETNLYLSRLVKLGITNAPAFFTKAIAATVKISLNGNGSVDSYDSNKGSYDPSKNRNANGGLATDSMAAGAVSIGNGKVFGRVSTGPGGTVTLGPNGVIGDVAWNNDKKGIQPGWTDSTMNVAFPSNAPPTGGPFSAPVATNGVMYLGNGTNQLSSLSGSGNTKPLIVTGNATLYVTGSISLSGNSQIIIQAGASLTLIVGGSVSLGGNGVANNTGKPASFNLVGLSSCTSISCSGNAAFIGTIDAPQAALTLSGNADFYGAAVVASATITGNGSVHFDEALATQAAQLGLVTQQWTEL